jgi:predicted lipoprotein with Yx(FWY)xxD motif
MRLTPRRARAILPLAAGAALLLAACQGYGGGSTAPSAAASAAAGTQLTVSHTKAGDALAGAGGKTLYILTNDAGGKSTCTSGACATAWPALKGDGSQVQGGSGVSGTFGTTTWADGTKQVTHNGQPLYYFTGDSAAGDSNGQGTNGVWFIAPVGTTPGGASSGGSQPSPTPYRAPAY